MDRRLYDNRGTLDVVTCDGITNVAIDKYVTSGNNWDQYIIVTLSIGYLSFGSRWEFENVNYEGNWCMQVLK